MRRAYAYSVPPPEPRKGNAVDMDRFFSDRNIERYRRLACAATIGTERTRLLGLMAEEEDKYLYAEKLRQIPCLEELTPRI
jgi:hypothetical protein